MTDDGQKAKEHLARLTSAVAERHSADVVLYSGEIDDSGAERLIEISRRPLRKNVFLMLATRGGEPDAAYRMMRCLQRHYDKITICIHGMCKSAGTLMAVGADYLVLSDFGELGPLDVQVGKQDELFENHSGLNVTQALTSLNERVLQYFRDSLVNLRAGSSGQLSTKLASEIASRLAIGVYEGIYRQIDPVQLGAMERAILIASEYGRRLAEGRGNVTRSSIDRLVTGYPSHSFIIDIGEAKTLFKNARVSDDTEEQLAESISVFTRDENKTTGQVVVWLNPPEEKKDEPGQPAEQGAEGVSGGGAEDQPSGDQPAEGPLRATTRRNGRASGTPSVRH